MSVTTKMIQNNPFERSRSCFNKYFFVMMEWHIGLMRGSRNFLVSRVQVSLTKKALTRFFFLVLTLFYRSRLGQYQRNLSNFKIPEEVQHFPRGGGGSNFFQGWGGSNCLFITHITCDFPGGSGPPVPTLWIRTWAYYSMATIAIWLLNGMNNVHK